MDGSSDGAAGQGQGSADRAALTAEFSLLENGFGKLLRESHRAFSSALQDQLAAHGVTLSQWRHLRTVWKEDGITQVALSRRIGIEKASSTAVLDRLEARKLIRRLRNKEDRRKSNLYLTPAGARLMEELIPCALVVNAAARQRLSPDEITAFLKTITTMLENLQRARLEKDWPPPAQPA